MKQLQIQIPSEISKKLDWERAALYINKKEMVIKILEHHYKNFKIKEVKIDD